MSRSTNDIDEEIELCRQRILADPQNAAAEHNLAAALSDGGRWAEAEPHIRAAFAKGSDAPETWLLLARALQSLGQLDDAEAAFVETIRRRVNDYDAQRDLAQLRWMRSGDPEHALGYVEAALDMVPNDARLIGVKALALQQAGHEGEALALLSQLAAAAPNAAFFSTLAAQAALAAHDYDAAAELATRALSLSPGEPFATTALVEARLALGDADGAEALALERCARSPLDQHAIAELATAWRLKGDPRYRPLFNYDAFVNVSAIDTPRGWESLPAYLADLAQALTSTHAYRSHPYAQSIRHGSQISDLLQRPEPVFRALPEALDGPIRRCLAALGQGDDPLRARNTGGYTFKGTWSIRMTGGGYHVDHVHPEGWLSSACYVDVPKTAGREGWLKFGEPGVVTTPKLDAEHFVQPEPGRLVLFPSYMWHGTVPFEGDATRLTFAFDLLPA